MSVNGINVIGLNKTVVAQNAAATYPFTTAPLIISGVGSVFAAQQAVTSGNLLTISGTDAAPNVVLVKQFSDLPAPVSNNITLSPNTIYKFAGIIPISNNYLTLDESTVLLGNAFRVDGFNSNWTGTVINSTNKTIEIRNLLLNSPSGNLFYITSTGANRATVQDCQISGCSGIGTISGIDALTVKDNRVQSNKDGFKIYGPASLIRFTENRVNKGIGPNYTGISFISGSNVIATLNIQTNEIQIDSSNQIGIYIQSGITPTGLLANNVLGGTGIFVSGIFKSDVNWKFQSNTALADSLSAGNIFCTGNSALTNFAATNTFVAISGFSQTGYILERFVMSSSGQMQYVGLEPFQGTILVSAGINPGGANADGSLGILKNGIYESPPGCRATFVKNQINPATFIKSISLNINDTITIATANFTNTTAFTVDNYEFHISKG